MSGFEVDFAIVGAGVVGLAAAAMLEQQGYRCVVIDPRSAPPPAAAAYDLRTYALTPASLRALSRADAIAALDRARVAPFIGMHVWDESSGGEIRFSAASLGRESLGSIVEHSNLVHALFAVATLRGGIRHAQARVIGCEQTDEHAMLHLDNGEHLRAALVLGCDGANSALRELLRIPSRVKDFAQSALVCNVETSFEHGSVARQRFLSGGPLAFLPLPPENQCAVVWSLRAEQASSALALEETDFKLLLAESLAHELGAVVTTSERKLFALRSLHSAHYVRGRAVLLGDAAHVVHPLAGQGLNLGVMDVAALSEAFTPRDELSLKFPHAAVRRFERARRAENLMMLQATSSLNELFRARRGATRFVRGAGMSALDKLEPLKRWIMLRAMGDSGDVPALARQ